MCKTIALIDTDIIIYKVATKSEFKDTGIELLELACQKFDDYIEHFKFRLNTPHMWMCLSSRVNFRKKIFPEYKAHRPPKPDLFIPLKQYVGENYTCKTVTGLEADDVLGLIMTTPALKNEYICCSIDKDMKTFHGTHFHWDKDEIFKVTKEEAIRWFYYQVLVGDSADGYKGAKGIGAKKAEVILGEAEQGVKRLDALHRRYWKAVKQTFKSCGQSQSEAIQNAKMARIVTYELWNQKKQQPYVWRQPK